MTRKASIPYLHELLAAHDRHAAEGGLPKCFGDGYLIATSPLYANVRASARALGFRYTRDDVGGYRVAPLYALHAILKKRAIPYRDNVSPLRKIERRVPRTFRLTEMPFPLANYVLHESAHGVADRVVTARALVDAECSAERKVVLRGLVGESFANAVEALSSFQVGDMTHEFLLTQNSYVHSELEQRQAWQAATRKLDARAQLKTLVYAFLVANFLYAELGDEHRGALRRLAGLDALAERDAARVIREAWRKAASLDQGFRLRTTPFYIKYQYGILRDSDELLDVDVLRIVERSAALRDAVDALVERVTG